MKKYIKFLMLISLSSLICLGDSEREYNEREEREHYYPCRPEPLPEASTYASGLFCLTIVGYAFYKKSNRKHN